ncbi:MAG: DUF72 domain-containing protein [Vicinamibacterales bacterium]
MSEVRVGTSGWNYPRGKGTWNGVFYPPSRGRAKSFDELAYYADRFDTVEINSTFYGQPREDVARGWVERTPDGFEFSVKLYQKFTHPGMFRKRVERTLPLAGTDLGAAWMDAVVEELARPTRADLDEFKRGIDPLASAGRLGALLAQFPSSFKSTHQERDYLESLLSEFGDFPVAVELRHRSWSDDVDATLDLLNAHGAAWVQIDEPKFRLSIRQNALPNIKGFYYMRLHGRNAAKWWKHDSPDDRYDYHYSEAELREFADTVGAVRRLVKKSYVYTNNHYSAKSVANALTIKRILDEPIEGEYPPEMIDRYPELRGVAPIAESAIRTRRN